MALQFTQGNNPTDTNYWQLLVSNANLTSSNYLAEATLTENQVLDQVTTPQLILFNNAYTDSQQWVDISNIQFYPTIPGYYMISVNLLVSQGTWDTNTNNYTMNLQINVNDLPCATFQNTIPTNNEKTIYGNKMVYLDGFTQYVTFTFSTNSTTAQTIILGDPTIGLGSYYNAIFLTNGQGPTGSGVVPGDDETILYSQNGTVSSNANFSYDYNNNILNVQSINVTQPTSNVVRRAYGLFSDDSPNILDDISVQVTGNAVLFATYYYFVSGWSETFKQPNTSSVLQYFNAQDGFNEGSGIQLTTTMDTVGDGTKLIIGDNSPNPTMYSIHVLYLNQIDGQNTWSISIERLI